MSKCIVCQKVKYERDKAPRLLQPLIIPHLPWQSISMKYIFGLPKSKKKTMRYGPLLIALVNKHTSCLLGRLLKQRTWPHYLFPKYFIVFDQDPTMTSLFWKGMFENLGTKLNFSLAYHPKTDGQSKVANSIILDLLKNYVGEVVQAREVFTPSGICV